MTMRARLTSAFLAVVLVPVLIGALFVSTSVHTVSRERSMERLDHATSAVRTALGALCGQLRTVAQSVANVAGSQRLALAQQLVSQGLAGGVYIEAESGGGVTELAPPPPWADCAGPGPAQPGATAVGFEGVAAVVPLVDDGNTAIGSVSAAVAVDADLVRRLAESSGAAITVLSALPPGEQTPTRADFAPASASAPAGGPSAPVGMSDPLDAEPGPQQPAEGEVLDAVPRTPLLSADRPAAAPEAGQTGVRSPAPQIPGPGYSTVEGTDAEIVGRFAHDLPEGGSGTADNGHLVRRLGPAPGLPLPLAVSLPTYPQNSLDVMLVAVLLVTALLAIAVASWLARTTTSPLAELAAAADRVAGGGLEARVPVRGNDEIGRLATAFNHMTRELQAYVAALTASRDQLRGHLGVLGDTLSSTHDLDRILKVILQTARHATGAASGVVMLTDPTTGELVAQCTEGLPGEAADTEGAAALRIAIGAGLVGSVAATGTPRIGRVERDGPGLAAGEPECRTYVVVPFSAPMRTEATGDSDVPAARGVLALYDRLGRDEFDDADLDTLRTFAGQAAVAVDNVRMHEEAQRLSVTDPLTGLLNYRSLRESMRREVDRASRFGRKLCVLTLDLDRFKEINDGYGHAAGDAVLAEFATRIRHEIREVDVAFRHGGEEFVVLLPETDEDGGIAVAERLGEAVRSANIVVPARANSLSDADLTVRVTVSIGLAVLPDHGANAATLLRAADDALYAAKAAGRDTFRVASVNPKAAGVAPVAGVLTGSGGASSGPQAPRQARGR